jgi:hypothetical protein
MDYAPLDRIRSELVKARNLWQFDLMSASKTVEFANDRKIPLFNPDTVRSLWRVGLLRADLVTSDRPIDVPSLNLITKEDDTYFFCDTRPVPHYSEGLAGSFASVPTDSEDVEIFFHPFRLYVLYHISRVFRVSATATQYLQYPEGLLKIADRHIKFLNEWTASTQCSERFEYWNRTAELAIASEPISYEKIFRTVTLRFPTNMAELRESQHTHAERLKALLAAMTIQEIDEFRGDLCQDAEIVDNNKMAHLVLRLTSSNERMRLRATLGTSMLLLCMAETIRRATEDLTGRLLREEDEMGFGQWMDGAKKSLYGSDRVLDANHEARRDALASIGLASGVKIKSYLEGETELGALISGSGDGVGAEFINLHGQVVEKRGKGLSFITSLDIDRRSHVFSLVMLDADSTDNVRALKKAAKDGTLFGRFFIAEPDFELANFTTEELAQIARDAALRAEQEAPTLDAILPYVLQARSGKAFFNGLKQAGLLGIEKSSNWGEALMTYAARHQTLPSGHPQANATRPIIEASRFIIFARRAGYVQIRDRFALDPETGQLHKK